MRPSFILLFIFFAHTCSALSVQNKLSSQLQSDTLKSIQSVKFTSDNGRIDSIEVLEHYLPFFETKDEKSKIDTARALKVDTVQLFSGIQNDNQELRAITLIKLRGKAYEGTDSTFNTAQLYFVKPCEMQDPKYKHGLLEVYYPLEQLPTILQIVKEKNIVCVMNIHQKGVVWVDIHSNTFYNH